MILRSLEVRSFRGIEHARFEDLSSELNLLHGSNESGKSTLVEALHFGLFERTRGQAEHKRAIRTWGSSEAPEVTVIFEDDDGEVWEVHKRFLDRPETELHIGANIRLTGDNAERRIRDLLDTRQGPSSGPRADDLGIWPVLWVRQGTAGLSTPEALTSGARNRLTETLSGHTGALLGADGTASVLQEIDRRHSLWWTPTGRLSARFKKLEATAREAALRRDEAEDNLIRWQRTLAEHHQAVERADDLDARVTKQRKATHGARARARRAEMALERLASAERDRDHAQLAWQQADDRARRQEDAAAMVTAAETRRATATTRIAAAQTARDDIDSQRTQLREERETLDARRAQLQEDLLQLARIGGAEAIIEQADDLRTRIDNANTLEAQARTLRTQLAAKGLTRADAERLGSLLDDIASVRDRRADNAARLTIELSVPATLDNDAIDGTLSVPVEKTRTVHIPDVGTIRIDPAPGADDDRLEAMVSELTTLRDRIGASSEADARSRLASWDALSTELVAVSEQLTLAAPSGISSLQTELARLEARLERSRQGGPTDDPDSLRDALDEVEAERARIEGQRAALAGAHTQAAESLAVARADLRSAEADAASACTERDELGDPRVLGTARDKARQALVVATEALDKARAEAEETGGADTVKAAREESQAAIRVQELRDEAHARVATLASRLRDLPDGLYEAARTAEMTARQAADAVERAKEEAHAVQDLHRTLHEAWERRMAHFVGPVQAAVSDGLRLLFPGSDLAVDDQGEVVGLRTQNITEAFADLSGGTREQLGVLVRLGIARVLAGDNRLPVVLDDALVNADPQRRARMVEVLRRASDHLQILVFTCHEEDFDRLAAPWRREVAARPPRATIRRTR